MENTNNENNSSLMKEKLKKYDTRGVQTLFRTLSRNHYMLLKMIDNKARIILIVNSIITSLLFGIHFINIDSKTININIGTKILVISSMLSMTFALISMLPHKYLGNVFKNSGYKGTLYAANFVKQSISEFKAEIERIMNSGNTVYNEMIYDIYFLGLVITKKQQLLYISVIVLLIGVLATLTYVIFSI